MNTKNALAILRKLGEWIKPGGFIVLEEPDFTTARSLNENEDANGRVNKAISKMFNDLALNPGFGTCLPKEAEKIGFEIFHLESKMHLDKGNSLMALMMGKSAEALKEKYVATRIASGSDVDEYIANSKNDEYWQVYYSTVSVILKSGSHLNAEQDLLRDCARKTISIPP